jgi:23S rRNA pseudouridine2605 synthase
VATLGQRVDSHDAISLDGRLLRREELEESTRRVLMYNKPEGQVCTRDDPEGRPTVFEHLPRLKSGRWINIGRLDINTTGLLMFTTDGELANRLMHPSYQMDREYAVRVRGEVDDAMIERLLAGVMLEDGPAKFSDIQRAPGGEGFNHWFHCVVMEGRNREVRRLWESQGVVVSRLKRVRFGPVFLTSDLSVGRWREMVQGEIDILAAEVGLAPVALPDMKLKLRDKLERLQRKSPKPAAARGPRPASGERPARVLRDENGAPIARKPRPSARRDAPQETGRGTPLAERPGDVGKKRPARPQQERPAPGLGERPSRKPQPSGKRPPATDGQRPGFGRKRP